MKIKQFLDKNKKIILFIVGFLAILIIAFVVAINWKKFQKDPILQSTNEKTQELQVINDKVYQKSLLEENIPSLHPFSEGNSAQKEMFALLKTNFINTEPNWHLAIQEGLASKENDFSKLIQNNKFQVAKFKPQYTLVLLKAFSLYFDDKKMIL
ncbi:MULTISPECIES: hypothetical protein [Candidatus Phytoplasma]|uniref:Uncharacterized protein n=1 Tax='Catharanthus roseus' aster yellows phytoplasma TaxID=1193712 RepID=A0A4P6MA24_9MOLU|nr:MULTISPECIES: hypothetical protein [Phytoplasma]OIJ44957.1 hypothetical protein BHE82_00090 [Rice orange leaf phytoplasma]QBF23664.1 hypothetical protein EXT02_00235 ['Catharanthus roseus' aster yellows phytoplasma]